MHIHVVVTSFNEPATIGKAVEQILLPNRQLWPVLQLVVVAPDQPTLQAAQAACQLSGFDRVRLVKDAGTGKPAALNLAVETITKAGVGTGQDDLLILTDGDVYLQADALRKLVAGCGTNGMIGGHPVSVDARTSMFGYYSQLFCQAAHVRRLQDASVPMSGYLYAVRADLLNKIFPIPEHVRAEDAYISNKLRALGYTGAYVPDALVYVKFPKTVADWYKQKTRSLGGNVQVSRRTRSIGQDLRLIFFPLRFATSPKELMWSIALYPLRLVLWVRIYFNALFNRYSTGLWARVESSK